MNIGRLAGQVWTILNVEGPLSLNSIKMKTKMLDSELYMAIGWLAREDKIQFDNGTYSLL